MEQKTCRPPNPATKLYIEAKDSLCELCAFLIAHRPRGGLNASFILLRWRPGQVLNDRFQLAVQFHWQLILKRPQSGQTHRRTFQPLLDGARASSERVDRLPKLLPTIGIRVFRAVAFDIICR